MSSILSLTWGTDNPMITWIAVPFLTTPWAPAALNAASGNNLLASFTLTLSLVAQLLSSSIFSLPPNA